MQNTIDVETTILTKDVIYSKKMSFKTNKHNTDSNLCKKANN